MTHQPRLPVELILQIVEASLSITNPHAIVDVSLPEVQLLVAWSQVCRATYGTAVRLLRQHCVYLDSHERIQKFWNCLSFAKTSAPSTNLPPITPLEDTSSLYLGVCTPNPQESASLGSLIRQVLFELGGSVRRLILELPAPRFAQENELDPHLGQGLFDGLAALSNVEEFVTVGGLRTVDFWTNDLGIWERWPKLRSLAGFQVDLAEEDLWHRVARAKHLEHMVIARPRLYRIQRWNFKEAIGQHWRFETGGDPKLARPISIVLADHEFTPSLIDETDAITHDPQGLVSAVKFSVPMSGKQFVRTDHACREWMMAAMKEGNLWDYGKADTFASRKTWWQP
ncbi:hypothetical protein CDV36_012358 [Fusarium kuroshium]|uniref:F-box domain-containing protein n=1 Tax=Fusarium kuroshium TaxID=2010991 RepID=A0A3M2RS46_9HYPO|nr:hypothetical protein CDV36_012358 [Fusarium kuroshium]